MKKISTLVFLVLLLISGFFNRAHASHLTGGEITWTCMGQDSFLINLIIYTDCNGINLGSNQMIFKCLTSGTTITSITTNPGSSVDITPVCRTACTRCQSMSCSFPFGIQKYVMQNIVILNNAGSCCQLSITWEQCCRSASLTTIFNGSINNLYISSILNRCQSPCDNSPSFSNPPIIILCVGQDATIDFGVADNDTNSNGGLLDSITYEMGHPMKGAGLPLIYTGQYAYNKPVYFWGFPNDALPIPRGFHLDPQTGIVQFKPMKSEQTVMVVNANEFRNGVKIGEVRRDIQVIVIVCTNKPPTITTPGNIRSKTICIGDTVRFNFQSGDTNTNDTVTLSWSNNVPGAIWTDNNGQVKHPSASLTWVPTASQAITQPYYFTVNAKDNACPISSQFSVVYQIVVKANVSGNYTVTKLACDRYQFNATVTQGSGFPFIWHGDINYYSPNFIHHFLEPGKYYFSFSTSSNYFCGNTIYDSIITDTFLWIKIPKNTTICYGNSINLNVQVFDSRGPVRFKWSTGDTTSSITVKPLVPTWYKIEVIDSINCPVVDSVFIQIAQPVKVFYDYYDITDTIVCIGQSVFIQSYSNFASYLWNTGDTYDRINKSNTKPTWYKVIATDNFGCTSSDSIFVDVYPDAHVYAGVDTSICAINGLYELKGSPDSLSGGKGWWTGTSVYQDASKKWHFHPDSNNVSNRGNYNVSYYYTDTFGCTSTAYAQLKVYKYNNISAGKDSSLCLNANPILLQQLEYPYGGYWIGSGISGLTFYPLLAGPGTYMLTYNIKDYCVFTDTTYITVFPLPDVQVVTNSGKTEFCPQGLIPLSGSPAGGLYGGQWSGDVEPGHFFNTSRPEGLYSVRYSFMDNNRCSTSDTIYLRVSFPKVTIDTVQKSVCYGKSILLKAGYNFATSVLWTNDTSSDGYFNGNNHSTEVYFVPGQNDFTHGGFWIRIRTFSTTCSIVKDSIYIRTGYNPIAGFSADKITGNIPLKVSFTDTSTIQSGSITGFNWDFGDGNNSIIQNPVNTYLNAGSYNVKLTTVSDIGCSDSLNRKNYISTTNSVPEDMNADYLGVYPNPAKGYIDVSFTEKRSEIEQLHIYNSTGTLIYKQNSIGQNPMRLDISNFRSGLYLLRVVSDKGVEYLAKFVKE